MAKQVLVLICEDDFEAYNAFGLYSNSALMVESIPGMHVHEWTTFSAVAVEVDAPAKDLDWGWEWDNPVGDKPIPLQDTDKLEAVRGEFVAPGTHLFVLEVGQYPTQIIGAYSTRERAMAAIPPMERVTYETYGKREPYQIKIGEAVVDGDFFFGERAYLADGV